MLTRIGHAYSDPDCDLASLHIEGGGQFSGTRIKLLYVAHLKPFSEGSQIEAGKPIGVSQEVAAYHMRHHPEQGVMSNHVHLELRVLIDGAYKLVDPAKHLAAVACT